MRTKTLVLAAVIIAATAAFALAPLLASGAMAAAGPRKVPVFNLNWIKATLISC